MNWPPVGERLKIIARITHASGPEQIDLKEGFKCH
jgi:hypothetical protein